MSGTRLLPSSGRWFSLPVTMMQGWGFELSQMVPGDGPQDIYLPGWGLIILHSR